MGREGAAPMIFVVPLWHLGGVDGVGEESPGIDAADVVDFGIAVRDCATFRKYHGDSASRTLRGVSASRSRRRKISRAASSGL